MLDAASLTLKAGNIILNLDREGLRASERVREKEKERERERERKRQTDRQTDRERERDAAFAGMARGVVGHVSSDPGQHIGRPDLSFRLLCIH